MTEFSFQWPWMLVLLLIIPLFGILYKHSNKVRLDKAVQFSRLAMLDRANKNTFDLKKAILSILFILALIFGIIALARPTVITKIPVNQAKLMLVFDISISMEAQDMKPDRLTVAKVTAIEFVKKLPKGIKVGLEYFYGNAYVPVELTFDKSRIIDSLSSLDVKNLLPGTAIGTAIDGAVNSIVPNLNSKEKADLVMVLLTDGESNQGIMPVDAAKIAQKHGIKIFTIGMGSKEGAIVRGGILSTLDPGTLMAVSNITGGKFYRAESSGKLSQIYKELSNSAVKLEKQNVEITFLFSGLSLLAFMTIAVLKMTIMRVIF